MSLPSHPPTLAASLPTFKAPPLASQPPDEPVTTQPNRADRRAAGERGKLATPVIPPKSGQQAPTARTVTSATDLLPPKQPAEPPDPKIMAAATLAVVGIAVVGAARAVRALSGRLLRKPTKPQQRAIAEPLGRLAGRHLPGWLVNEDMKDLIEAGGALSAYLEDGPLLSLAPTKDGFPPDQEQPR